MPKTLMEVFRELEGRENILSKRTCRGLYWRGRVNSFFNDKRIETRKSLRFLKRLSCPGCEQCDWLWVYFGEDIGCNGPEDYLPEIEDGHIYTFKVHSSQGYYDLYAEIDNIEFVEVANSTHEAYVKLKAQIDDKN